MQAVILAIWIFQGLLMVCDEFYFHQKRGLGKWESIGHPIDTFCFLAVFIFCLILPYSQSNLPYFIGISVLSTLIITKDEWVHSHQCSPLESWFHALLFIIHPIAIAALYFSWLNDFTLLIQIQSSIIMIFMLYQILYWNIFRGNKYETKS